MSRQNGMNRALKVTDAFAVNDSDLKYSCVLARRQVIGDEVTEFVRLKRMQIEHAIDRHLNWFVFVQSEFSTVRTATTRPATRTLSGKSDGASKVYASRVLFLIR